MESNSIEKKKNVSMDIHVTLMLTLLAMGILNVMKVNTLLLSREKQVTF